MRQRYTVGIHGKLPSHGDFLRRRVSDDFVRVWDAWLQECMAAAQSALGERWLEVYLTSPAWRFAAAASACGHAPMLGVLIPSVDCVGRYFPLTLAVELPETVDLVAALTAATSFFDAAEQLVIETLAVEDVDFARFDERVLGLADHLGPVTALPSVLLEAGASAVFDSGGTGLWQLPLGPTASVGPVFQQVLFHGLTSRYDPLVLWSTGGSAIVEPSCLMTRGLPPPASFGAFLDGAWGVHGWNPVAGHINQQVRETEVPGDPPVALYFRSAAVSDVGRVRDINQDAFLDRPDAGIWAVADGLGGHSHGEIASQMVCNALGALASYGSFDELVSAADQRLQQVEEELHRAVTERPELEGSGSTVVTLLARGDRCAVLWAGDSRAYRWRGGALEQITRDHSLAAVRGAAFDESSVITRAVGGPAGESLELDVLWDGVAVGDRFLLCSDGLTRVLTDDAIKAYLETPSIRDGVDRLVRATLDAGAPDNVTVLIVEAYREDDS